MRFISKVLGVVLCPIAVVTTPSCATEPATDSTQAAPTSSMTSSPFPFPPLETIWDSAVPLSPQQQAAVEVVFQEMDLVHEWRPKFDPTIPPEILAIVGPENKPVYLPVKTLAETGGEMVRVVDVRALSSSQWEFDMCRYDSPGAYSMGPNGQLQLSTPHIVYPAATHTVSWTTEPNGAGERSDNPRFLVVDVEPIINDMARQTCEPFRPDPYIQQPPQPLSSGK